MMCHKSHYLHKYRLLEETEKRFETGYRVGDLALGLFPGGVLVPFDGLSFKEQIANTASLISEGCSTIYEAS